MVRRTPQGIRIKTRNGYDWSDRYPLIVAAAERLAATCFVIDGEGVILKADGISDFDRLHSRRHDSEVQLLGFDLLELDGTDRRREPLENRKATLASLLRRSHAGIQLVEHVEAEHGGIVFDHACRLGLEGIVSNRRDTPYRSGRSGTWLKGEGPRAPGHVSRLGGSVLMTREASGAQFEIKVDGLVRTHRDFRETAIEAARFFQQRLPGATVIVTDLRDGSAVPFERG
jgi:bifunctional non-homologous end joining protein LigD